MEEKKVATENGVGIGSILAPGTYKVEGEELLLRVRLQESPLVCLIDGSRRVREILAAPAAPDPAPAPDEKIAFDSRRLGESEPCPEGEAGRPEQAAVAGRLAEWFESLLQRYAADGRTCLRKMAHVLDRGNARLACELGRGGFAGLKAFLIRELFKRTVREERGFKVLLLLSHLIALDPGGQPERLEALTLEQQKQLLREFMDFLKVAGHMRIDPRIFEEIHDKFNDLEYDYLSRGGTGFFIKPLYIQEMQELKAQVLNSGNANYIEQLYRNSLREPLDFLYENTLAYLKALAIVRLYANSNRRQRGGDSRIVEHLLGDLLRFRPAWVKSAGKASALSA
ncbi:MAG: hypothetical protein MUC72_06245 [Acidobacteria bacterium]|jgi:hypothetical protein|nr:hypothetical protein [Acidobacteriota bacterium]